MNTDSHSKNQNECLNSNQYSLTKDELTYFQSDNLEIKILAENLLNEQKEFSKKPLDLAKIILHLGLNVEYKDNVENLVNLNRKNKTIEIKNDNVNIKKKLYKIAVEIGKYVLDKEFGVSDDENRIFYNHLFAINLLMPYNETRNKILLGYSIQNISDYFNIPYDVAYNRYNYIINRII